jgi:hypothetical protein
VLRKDIKATPLVRPDADVALALDTRVPDHPRGRVGLGFAIAILIAVGILLGVDLWAFFGWRGTILADDRETRERRLRVIRAHRAARSDEPVDAPVALRSVA